MEIERERGGGGRGRLISLCIADRTDRHEMRKERDRVRRKEGIKVGGENVIPPLSIEH